MKSKQQGRRSVRCDFWVNEKTASLSALEKMVLLWVATSGNFTCAHRASERSIRNAVDRAITVQAIRSALEKLDRLGLIVWDEEEEVVFAAEGLDEQNGGGVTLCNDCNARRGSGL